MNDRLQTDHERTEALAYRIYLQEKQPSNHAKDHWQRAEDALRKLDESASPRAGAIPPDQLERGTLHCANHGAISGLALIYRLRPDDGGKFYPGSLQEVRTPLELPATLHLEETAETFDLVRLQSGSEGEACFDISFRE